MQQQRRILATRHRHIFQPAAVARVRRSRAVPPRSFIPVVARVASSTARQSLRRHYRDPSKYLASVYRQQESSLRRRGFPRSVVQSEMAALDRAFSHGWGIRMSRKAYWHDGNQAREPSA